LSLEPTTTGQLAYSPALHGDSFVRTQGPICQARKLQSSEKCRSSREVFLFITLFVNEAFLPSVQPGTQLALLDVFPSQDIARLLSRDWLELLLLNSPRYRIPHTSLGTCFLSHPIPLQSQVFWSVPITDTLLPFTLSWKARSEIAKERFAPDVRSKEVLDGRNVLIPKNIVNEHFHY